ncbi:MAG TPA: XRE family transcriptional regulator [Terriglobales bacterium]|nr:XRE family transcriptional regulator [Terriglobales bacterium]
MSDLRSNLRNDFHDKEFRHVYADESLNTYIATQIKVLREQQDLTQKDLAILTGMAQPRIAVLEDINYSSWSINTLRRLARAFDLRLSVKFESFSSLVPELETFGRNALERTKFADDNFFHKKPSEAENPAQGATARTDAVIGADVFQEHMLRMAVSRKKQESMTISAPQPLGGNNAALSSAIG